MTGDERIPELLPRKEFLKCRKNSTNMTARRVALVEIFAGKAEWRRQKAVEHPDDKRNLEAATIFDRLARSVDGVPPTTLNSFFELYEDYEGDELSEELRQVGFHSDPKTAEDFCRSYIASRTSERRQ